LCHAPQGTAARGAPGEDAALSSLPDGGDAEVGLAAHAGPVGPGQAGHLGPGGVQTDLKALDLTKPAIRACLGDPVAEIYLG